MNISSHDRIELLSSSLSTNSSTPPTTPYQDGTIHNISPATTAWHTEVEGDNDYQEYLLFSHDRIVPVPTYTSTSSSSKSSCEDVQFERTLAIIKPEAMGYSDVVLRAINESGLKLINQRTVHLTPEQVADLYAKYYGNPVFPYMVVSMCVGPMMVMSLGGVNAVERWKTLVGQHGMIREEWFHAYSVRTRFGYQRDIADMLHTSDNNKDAAKENRFFYPTSILEPIIYKQDQVTDYIQLFINPTLSNGLTEVVRVKPIDPVLFLAEWLLLNNPYKPKMPDNVLLQPT